MAEGEYTMKKERLEVVRGSDNPFGTLVFPILNWKMPARHWQRKLLGFSMRETSQNERPPLSQELIRQTLPASEMPTSRAFPWIE